MAEPAPAAAWHSLYLPVDDAQGVVLALREVVQALDYTPYDPFPGGKGPRFRVWQHTVRHFVSPVREGWVRILGEPLPDSLPELAERRNVACIHVWVSESDFGALVYQGREQFDSPESFQYWLRAGKSLDDLTAALAGPPPELPDEAVESSVMGIPVPDNVNPRRVEKMTQRLSKRLFKRMGDDAMRQEAEAMLGGGESLWQTPGGRRVRALMACLTVPEAWRVPDYPDLREAYQVARARQHNPGGKLLPGDADALAAVPDALDFTPVFLGRR